MPFISKTSIPRRRGRPGPSVKEDVRQDILNAAERLLALQGFSATTIRQIADEVKVNPAMVHYYFDTKQSLLEAVMSNALEPLAESLQALQQKGEFKLSEFTSLLFSVMARHPTLPQLIAREVFLPGGIMQQHFLDSFAPRLGGRLPGILIREQQAGRLDPDLDPGITALLVLSLCFFPFIARTAANQALNISYDEAGLAKIAGHVNRILQTGIGT